MAARPSIAGANVDSNQPAGSSPIAPVTTVDTPTFRERFRGTQHVVDRRAGRKIPEQRGDLDVVRVTPERVAVAAQHVELVGDVLG